MEGVPLHVIQRGNNRGQVFFTSQDAADFLTWLEESAAVHGVAIHAYVLMPNHVHLLATPARPESLPKCMQTLGRRYVRAVNWRHGRTGSLWEGRYRATIIDSDRYLFVCSRYIELNPVRANLTRDPAAYRWSSYRANAQGRHDPLVTPHMRYDSLGDTAAARAESYRAMFTGGIDQATLEKIRLSTHRGWALGDEAFCARMSAAGRRAAPLAKGKPIQSAAAATEPFLQMGSE
jgi:putative transposase